MWLVWTVIKEGRSSLIGASHLSKQEVSSLAKHKTTSSLLAISPVSPSFLTNKICWLIASLFRSPESRSVQLFLHSPPHPTPHFTKTTLAEITPMLSSYVSLLTTLLVKCYPWMVFLATFLPWPSSSAAGGSFSVSCCRLFAGGLQVPRPGFFLSPQTLYGTLIHSHHVNHHLYVGDSKPS